MIGYNEKWVKSVSLKEFLEHQAHHEKDTDLTADYERITGKKEAKIAPKVNKKG